MNGYFLMRKFQSKWRVIERWAPFVVICLPKISDRYTKYLGTMELEYLFKLSVSDLLNNEWYPLRIKIKVQKTSNKYLTASETQWNDYTCIWDNRGNCLADDSQGPLPLPSLRSIWDNSRIGIYTFENVENYSFWAI